MKTKTNIMHIHNINVCIVSHVILVLTVHSFAATNYVWQTSPSPTPPHSTWVTAAHTIQAAVDVALSGNIVLVTNGIYAMGERVTPGYACSNRVVVTNSITIRSVNGPTASIIQGSGPVGTGAVRGVYMKTGCLIGFTITNGYTCTSGNFYYDQCGGGIYMSGSNCVVSNCTITVNNANYDGGGSYGGTLYNCTISRNTSIRLSGGGSSDSTLFNCTITSNSAYGYGGGSYGGTLYNCIISSNNASDQGGGSWHSTLSNCTISGNSAYYFGGGAYGGTLYNCIIDHNTADNGGGSHDGTLYNCTISENSVGFEGGGSYASILYNCLVMSNSAPWSSGGACHNGALYNCILVGNSAKYSGGGASHARVNNCTIYGNNATNGGGTYYCAVTNSIVWGNSDNDYGSSFGYSCSMPLPIGAGNIASNPFFVNASAGNYHLQEGSPCIDAGSNAYALWPFDLDGNPRIIDDTVDMGAYEGSVPEPSSLSFICVFVLMVGIWRQ